MRTSRLIRPLCTLLLAAAAAAGCGGSGGGDARDKEAAEWALKLNGTVVVAGREGGVKSVDDLPPSAYRLLKIDLNRAAPPVTDKLLEQLPAAQGVEYLGLHSAQITDRGVAPISRLQGLKELELSYTQIGDAGLDQLAGLKKLGRLYLYGTQVTEEGIEQFKKKRPKCAVYRD